jgi:DeoD family purine-nucleoside phosphorylase
MSIHIAAKKGSIAETVLMPGDPLRAKYIAENFLEGARCYTEVRNMYGYTGTYRGKRVSIQGSGMGIPSIGIYVNELIDQYDVKRIIRIGSCGAIQKKTKIRDIILAMSASGKSIAGSCRYSKSKAKKSELAKLKEQCSKAKLKAETFVIFSKGGFSNELKKEKSANVKLFTLKNLKSLMDDLGEKDLLVNTNKMY